MSIIARDETDVQQSSSPSAAAQISQRMLDDMGIRVRAAIPHATYRIQFHAGFTFMDATKVVPYLAKLGIGALYASPIFQARPGSTHGYDIIDYGTINEELGGARGFRDLADALRRHGLGLILDFVPNHMGIGAGENAWWLDVVENGPWSPSAAAFDIDWAPIRAELRNKVLIPILGDHYGVVLENGELTLRFDPDSGSFWLDYYNNPFPITPQTYPTILRHRLDDLLTRQPQVDGDILELQSIIGSLERLPGDTEATEGIDPITARSGEQTVAKRRLAELARRSAAVADMIEQATYDLNGSPADPRSFDALDALIERQSFRLAFWRVAAEEINYRRFFAINDLAAIRQEEAAVFQATHRLLLSLVADGIATGVRIDHPDGLWDPAAYFANVQRAVQVLAYERAYAQTEHDTASAPNPSWEQVRDAIEGRIEFGSDGTCLPLYLLVEKILEHGEDLRSDWPVHGTTGYEFAVGATALFVDSANRKAFDDLYAAFVGERVRFADMVYTCKHLIMRVALASEVAVLANSLDRITEHTRRSRDFTLNNLRDALREIIACFPVYRTYLSGCSPDQVNPSTMTDRDRRYVDQAIREARKRNPAVDPTVYGFIRDVILQDASDDLTPEQVAERCRFAMKFQQLTGPVMAKGLEDTAFYRYNRLSALNEVGGDPTQFGITPAQFHRDNVERQRRWPAAMLASSTHDTKRAEDVRARLATLSEMPREWRRGINRWARLNRKHKRRIEGTSAPDKNDEYLFYQTLLGAWPLDMGDQPDESFIDRMTEYMLKALREAQIHTSWVNPNDDYEGATAQFVRRALDARASSAFLADLAETREIVAHCGALTSLSMQVLKLTSPGVPDLYQGTELFDLSLVDPDNRRPVDFDLRDRLLNGMSEAPAPNPDGIGAELADGRLKLRATARILRFRAEHSALFRDGDYLPLETRGAGGEHVVAYSRTLESSSQVVITVVPRLVHGLLHGQRRMPTGTSIWGDTTIAGPIATGTDTYRNLVDGSGVTGNADGLRVAHVLAHVPVAVLIRED